MLAAVQREKAVAETRAQEAEDALACLQSIIPVGPQNTLVHTLTNLVNPLFRVHRENLRVDGLMCKINLPR